MSPLRSVTVETPVGDFHIIIDTAEIARASGFGTLANLTAWLPEDVRSMAIESIDNHKYATLVQAYFRGDRTALDTIPRTQPGTEFQKACWHAIGTVPFGHTISYKQLANIAGKPAAIRAAGTICGKNRLALLIPCHRILKSDGSVGSYLYGSDIKEELLKHEQNFLSTDTTTDKFRQRITKQS